MGPPPPPPPPPPDQRSPYRGSDDDSAGGAVVILNVYEFVKLDRSPSFYALDMLGCGAYHSGVEVLGSEHCFTTHGIESSRPPKLAGVGYRWRESIVMGRTWLTNDEIEAAIDTLAPNGDSDDGADPAAAAGRNGGGGGAACPHSDSAISCSSKPLCFIAASYHALQLNCHHFSEALCAALLPPVPRFGGLPGWVNRAAGAALALRQVVPGTTLRAVDSTGADAARLHAEAEEESRAARAAAEERAHEAAKKNAAGFGEIHEIHRSASHQLLAILTGVAGGDGGGASGAVAPSDVCGGGDLDEWEEWEEWEDDNEDPAATPPIFMWDNMPDEATLEEGGSDCNFMGEESSFTGEFFGPTVSISFCMSSSASSASSSASAWSRLSFSCCEARPESPLPPSPRRRRNAPVAAAPPNAQVAPLPTEGVMIHG